MNNTSLQGIDRGLGAIPGPHFIEHRAYMNPNGFFRDMEIFGDLAIAASLSDTGKDLSLPGGKFNSWHAFGQTVESDVRKVAQAAIDVLNGV